MRTSGTARAALALAVLTVLLSACSSTDTSDTASGGDDGGGDSVKVGVLQSLSGTMSISEVAVKNAEVLAIEQVNAAGGVLGKKLEAVVEDGASDWPTFAQKADKLLTVDKVKVVFGGWTSASRKAMLPVFEGRKGLLFYPVQYEGLEQSPNIFYTGATTNQQIIPGLEYLKSKGLNNVYLVGSDYVFPRTANKEIRAFAAANGMNIVGEDYLPLGDNNVSTIVTKVADAKPQAVFNTLNGDTNVAFFKELKAKGVTPEQIPVISVSVAEQEIRGIGVDNIKGHLTAWNYYQTTANQKNTEFVAAYKAKYGQDQVTDDPMEAGYNSVYIWKAAVEKAGSFDVEAVKAAAKGLELDTPEGKVTVDGENQHVFKTARIGKVNDQGLIDEVFSSGQPIKPDPCLLTYPFAGDLDQSPCKK